MKVLVIGGSVFVSKALVRKLLSESKTVYVLNRGSHKNVEGTIHLYADRNNPDLFLEAIGNLEFDVVYDICAYFPKQTRIAIDSLGGRIGHFVHMSSATVYNRTNRYPMREEDSRGESDIWGDYSKNKYLCEEELFSAWTANGFPATMLRPFYIYGPGNNFDRESYVMKRLLHRAPIVLPGMGERIIQLSHIDDVVDTLIKISNRTESFGQAYNVGGNEYVTFSDWVETCAMALEVKAKTFCVESKYIGYTAREWFPFRDINFFGSCEKIMNQTGIMPKYSLLKGLQQTFSQIKKDDFTEFKTTICERAIIEKHLELIAKG